LAFRDISASVNLAVLGRTCWAGLAEAVARCQPEQTLLAASITVIAREGGRSSTPQQLF
jgi:hypothetical protein